MFRFLTSRKWTNVQKIGGRKRKDKISIISQNIKSISEYKKNYSSQPISYTTLYRVLSFNTCEQN